MRHGRRWGVCLLVASCALLGCRQRQFNGEDSKVATYVSGGKLFRIEIKEGLLEVAGSEGTKIAEAKTNAGRNALARDAVTKHLYYLLLSLPKGKVTLSFDSFPEASSVDIGENGFVTIRYNVKILLVSTDPAFPGDSNVVKAYLPRRSDDQARLAFYERYKDCSIHDLAPMPSDRERADFFFYHGSIFKPGCKIVDDAESGSKDLMVLSLPSQEMSVSENAARKPEYEKVWEDGRLKVSVMIALTKGELSHDDAGVAAYNMLFTKMRRSYPNHVITVDNFSGDLAKKFVPGPDYQHFTLRGKEERGEMEVSVTLVPYSKLSALAEGSPARLRYEQESRDSDLIVYAGHADYGGNIESLNTWGNFQTGHYSLFFLNSCMSLGYFSSAARKEYAEGILERLSKLNGGVAGTKYADFLVNGTNADMYATSQNVLVLIDALRGGRESYGDILLKLDQKSIPVIVGEEDNP